MKINSIKYHNYRCFEDVEINFDTSKEKNISLITGVIGSGKTEMLFSFQWVLYGFDFKKLREKKETPYSLNSTLYHQLEIDSHSQSKECWVELVFTHNGSRYFMKRSETFLRNRDKIESITKVSLSHTLPTGERSLPETNKDNVEILLSRIIPKSIIEGITFDGERMKVLTNADDQSKETIKSVISLVTNESLFSLCLSEIKHSKEDLSKEKQKISRQSGNTSAEDLEKEIRDLEDDIDDKKIKISGIDINLERIENKLDSISLELSDLAEANKLEEKRKNLEKDLEREKKLLNQNVENFYKRLADGYTIVTDQLVGDVKQSLENIDVPTGLTVEAVKSIIKRPKCICGCDMSDDVVLRLKHLMANLPPDNISSTLLYMANQFDDEKKRTKELLRDAYNAVKDSNNEVSRIKLELSGISSSLIENVSSKVRELEEERNKSIERKGRLNQDKDRYTSEIERETKRLTDAKKELINAAGSQEHIIALTEQQNVLELFKKAIEKINEKNSELSLSRINELLTSAFDILSEDKGRSVYICQYEKKEKYRLITYVNIKFQEKKSSWINSGYIRALSQDGLSDNEIKEKIIIAVAEGKSTGQSKTNSLAFAKAILDYSNEDRTDDELKVSHDYPFLIDSPFTELSGGNLEFAAINIHSFANQIILMVDDKSYSGVESHVAPYVNSKTYLKKDIIKGITYIS